MTAADQYFTVGGNLLPDAPSYIEREADDELYEHLRQGEYCYILTTRQTGKSSLMIRTAERLRQAETAVATVDLTGIGKEEITSEQWYFGVADEVLGQLDLEVDLDAWWDENSRLPAVQRLMQFFRDVVLEKMPGPVVIFIDEIDSTIGLSFTDDFFAAIRYCYNGRSSEPKYRRLSFVLLGVAAPADLISDETRTPFNIGAEIQLTDFTRAEAEPLARGLSREEGRAGELLDRVLWWTDGHPYLTQKLCQRAADQSDAELSSDLVDRVVESEFLAPRSARQEKNLRFVGERLANRKDGRAAPLLRLYRRILGGTEVQDDSVSPLHLELKLTGIVKPQADGRFVVRNRVYSTVFDRKWVNSSLPRRPIIRATAISLCVAVLTASLYLQVIYPRQLIANLEQTVSDMELATDLRSRLQRVPFYGRTADRLWGELGLRRLNKAIEDDRIAGDAPAAYDVANDAHAEIVDLGPAWPVFQDKADRLLAEFYRERALRAAQREQRGAAILWRLKSLSARVGSDDEDRTKEVIAQLDSAALKARNQDEDQASRAVGQLLDVDLPHLAATMKPDEFSSGPTLLPGGRWLGGSTSTGIALWDLDDLQRHATNAAGQIETATPDAKRLLTKDDAKFMIWDLTRDGPLESPMFDAEQPTRIVRAIISPNGRWVMTEGTHDVYLWDATQSERRLLFSRGLGPSSRNVVADAAISPDSRWLAVAEDMGAVRVWNLESPDSSAVELPVKSARLVVMSPDSRWLAIEHDDSLSFWSLPADGKLTPHPPTRTLAGHRFSRFSERGSRLMTVHSVTSFQVRNITAEGPQEPAAISFEKGLRDYAFSPDARWLIVDPEEGDGWQIWELDADEPQAPIASVKRRPFGWLRFDDAGRFFTIDQPAGVQRWELATGRPEGSRINFARLDYSGILPPLFAQQVTRHHLLVGDTGRYRVWRIDRSPPAIGTPPTYAVENVSAVAVGPEEKFVVAGDSKGTTLLWKGSLQEAASAVGPHAGPVTVVTFSPDGSLLLTAGEDGVAHLWNASTRAHVGEPLIHARPASEIKATRPPPDHMLRASVVAAAFLSDGKRLATAQRDGTVRFWEIPACEQKGVVRVGRLPYALAFSPDDKYLLAGCGDEAQVFDVTSRERVSTLDGTGQVTALAFTHKGDRVVTGSDSGLVIIWSDWNTDQPKPTFVAEHAGAVRAVAFRAPGTVLSATAWWVHRNETDNGDRIFPKATRLLPGVWKSRGMSGLDDKGEQLKAVLCPGPNSLQLATIRFDKFTAQPVAGNPEELFANWSKRLAIEITETGDLEGPGLGSPAKAGPAIALQLTREERRLLALMQSPLDLDQIGQEMGLERDELDTLRRTAFAKIGVANREDAARWVMENKGGFVEMF